MILLLLILIIILKSTRSLYKGASEKSLNSCSPSLPMSILNIKCNPSKSKVLMFFQKRICVYPIEFLFQFLQKPSVSQCNSPWKRKAKPIYFWYHPWKLAVLTDRCLSLLYLWMHWGFLSALVGRVGFFVCPLVNLANVQFLLTWLLLLKVLILWCCIYVINDVHTFQVDTALPCESQGSPWLPQMGSFVFHGVQCCLQEDAWDLFYLSFSTGSLCASLLWQNKYAVYECDFLLPKH